MQYNIFHKNMEGIILIAKVKLKKIMFTKKQTRTLKLRCLFKTSFIFYFYLIKAKITNLSLHVDVKTSKILCIII